MKIYSQINQKLHEFFVLPYCTIQMLKEAIQIQTGITAARQIIFYKDRLLEDKKKVTEYHIKNEDVVLVIVLEKSVVEERSERAKRKLEDERLQASFEKCQKETEKSLKESKKLKLDSEHNQVFKRQQKRLDLEIQKHISSQIKNKMVEDSRGKDQRLKNLRNNIQKMKKPQLEKEKQVQWWRMPRLRQEKNVQKRQVQAPPKRQAQNLKGAEFFETLKKYGIYGQCLQILWKHEVDSTQNLKVCTEEMLKRFGITEIEVKILKALFKN